TQSLGLVTALTLAAVFAAGRGGFWPLVGLEMLFGVLWALDFPARRTALYALVGSRRVATAISLETVSMQVAKMVGPVLAGVGLEWLGGLVAADGLGALLGALAIAGRRGFLPHGRIFGVAVLAAPFLLLGFTSLRWPWACLPVLLLIGACESAFAAMQSTLVL